METKKSWWLQVRRLYYRIMPTYERLDLKLFSYERAEIVLKETANQPEESRWVLAPEEDGNRIFGKVFLERRKRILE